MSNVTTIGIDLAKARVLAGRRGSHRPGRAAADGAAWARKPMSGDGSSAPWDTACGWWRRSSWSLIARAARTTVTTPRPSARPWAARACASFRSRRSSSRRMEWERRLHVRYLQAAW